MAVLTTLVDDLDFSIQDGVQEVSFICNDKLYTIDLGEKNRERLTEALAEIDNDKLLAEFIAVAYNTAGWHM